MPQNSKVSNFWGLGSSMRLGYAGGVQIPLGRPLAACGKRLKASLI